MTESLPVTDVSILKKYHKPTQNENNDFKNDSEIQALSNKLTDSMSKWGFMYITDHTISQQLIDKSMMSAKSFFDMRCDVKDLFLRSSNDTNAGYVPFKVETFEKSRPFDLKECFQFSKSFPKPHLLNQHQPDLIGTQSEFVRECKRLALLLMKAIACSLVPDDLDFFTNVHNWECEDGNMTTMRLLHYPPVNGEEVLENQLRCGEHADYGTITLLFQDQAGGLQVVSPSGKYIDATPVPGAIIINTGAMMEIWSSGRFPATKHRVVVPNNCNTSRQSMVYFVHPDNKTDVHCLDGSNKYDTVNSYEFVMKKFSETY